MNMLARWNPFRELEAMQNRMGTLWGRSLLAPNGEETITATEWSPLVDVIEDDKEYLVKAELPEVKKEDVKVTFVDGALHISGERKFEKEEKNRRYHRIERAYGSFDRAFVLPEGTKPEEIKASFHDGLLEVHLPKCAEPKGNALEVNVS
jgi:HSP20 family protein